MTIRLILAAVGAVLIATGGLPPAKAGDQRLHMTALDEISTAERNEKLSTAAKKNKKKKEESGGGHQH